MNNPQILGIDIGRVIIAGDTDHASSIFSRDYLQAPAVAGAIAAVAALAQRHGPACVHLVSKCGDVVAGRSLEWLHHNGVFTATGITPAQVHFCRERHEKQGICDALEIGTFIDDRMTVLEHLRHLPRLYLFDPTAGELRRYEAVRRKAPGIKLVRGWGEVLERMGV